MQSVLQVVVQGLPWAYTQEQLSPMFQQFGNIVSAEVVYGRDGRSRVRSCCLLERARLARRLLACTRHARQMHAGGNVNNMVTSDMHIVM